MSKKQWAILGVTLSTILAILLLWRVIDQPRVEFSGPDRIKDNPQSLPDGVPDPDSPDTLDKLRELAKTNKRDAIAKFRASGASAPIEFYAKLIDQHNEPIVGADVEIEIGQAIPGGGWENVIAKTKTNSAGQFGLNNIRGEKYIVTRIHKPGYLFNSSVNKLFWTWERTKGMKIEVTTPETPWIYKGWKIGEVADVKTVRIGGNIIPDSRPYTIKFSDNLPSKMDFQEGSNGDITISITRDVTPKGKNWFAHEYNSWSFNMQITNGGVIEIPQDEVSGYLYSAPESGYVSSVNESRYKDAPNWQRESKKYYYVNLKNGNIYGRISAHVYPFYNKDYAPIDFLCAINLNGSRNLLGQDTVNKNTTKNNN